MYIAHQIGGMLVFEDLCNLVCGGLWPVLKIHRFMYIYM
jgi:hypothetical protein